MSKIIDIETFLQLSESIPVIDVRSPIEFDHAHIPGAISIPLFSDLEREKVGICYKHEGKEPAILMALEMVGPKMADLARKAKELALENKLIVHCWRGGMRSSSMAWLLNTVGIDTYTLEGGYKTYRRHIKSYFTNKIDFVVIGGMTGSGKTEILKELSKLNQQVIDFEGLANHKGSAFGALGQDEQCSTEQFENNLFEILKKLDLNKQVWVEDESQTIGKIWIPEELFHQVRSSDVIQVNLPKNERIKWLVKEYGNFSHDLLKSSIDRIKKRLGGLNHHIAIEALNNSDLEKLVDIVLAYYDKTYQYGLSQRNQQKLNILEIDKMNHVENAKKVLEFYLSINRIK